MQRGGQKADSCHGWHPKRGLELAEVFNRYWESFSAHHKYSRYQQKVVRAIQACRTAVLGGHIESCSNPDCDYTTNAYLDNVKLEIVAS